MKKTKDQIQEEALTALKYVNTEEVKNWFSDKLSCDKIVIKNNVNYLVNEISSYSHRLCQHYM